MRILILGATGMLGVPVTRRLQQDGYEVTAMVRQPDVAKKLFSETIRIVRGDVTEPDTIRAAMEGCDALYLTLRGGNTLDSYRRIELQGTENVLKIAHENNIRRIGYLGGAGDWKELTDYPIAAIKRDVENMITGSGIEFTIFKATHFMESLDKFIFDGRATIIGRQPHKYHYLAAEDYARMVSKSYQVSDAGNCVLTLLGPDAYTMEEALQVYCRICYPQVKIGTIPNWLFSLIGRLKKNQDMVFAAMLFREFTHMGEAGAPALANRLLGKPVIGLSEWAEKQARPVRQ